MHPQYCRSPAEVSSTSSLKVNGRAPPKKAIPLKITWIPLRKRSPILGVDTGTCDGQSSKQLCLLNFVAIHRPFDPYIFMTMATKISRAASALLRARQASHTYASSATSISEAARTEAAAPAASVESFRQRLQQGCGCPPLQPLRQARLSHQSLLYSSSSLSAINFGLLYLISVTDNPVFRPGPSFDDFVAGKDADYSVRAPNWKASLSLRSYSCPRGKAVLRGVGLVVRTRILRAALEPTSCCFAGEDSQA